MVADGQRGSAEQLAIRDSIRSAHRRGRERSMRALRLLVGACIAAARGAAADAAICPAPSPASLTLAPIPSAICAPSEAPKPPPKTAPTRADDTDVLPFDAWRERHEDPADAAKARGKRARSDGEAKKAETAAASAARPDTSMPLAASNASVDPDQPAIAPSAEPAAALEPLSVSEDTAPPVRYVQPQPHAGTGAPEDPLLPLRTRTNYASLDCAAAVLRSSSGSKGPTSILSSAKDRYMLTPCNVRDKFVVVELCEEIAIDAVVLANWEFFSSMFKLVRARVSEVFPGTDADWRDLGTFRAGNVRGPQVRRMHTNPAEPSGLQAARSAGRLLPLPTRRLPRPLRHRVLLPGLAVAGLRQDADGGVEG